MFAAVLVQQPILENRREAVFLFVAVRESAFGQKRTSFTATHMSAFWGNADMVLNEFYEDTS